ncbi:MAG: NUDIX domain-containing protein [Bacillota bacterium]
MPIDEMLAIYDDELNQIGVAPRAEAHARGLLHQVVHCWLIAKSHTEDWLYLQQRSLRLSSFPGWYDIAAAGHIDLNESPEHAVIRETREELGVVIEPSKLEHVGVFREAFEFDSYRDYEICQVYLYPVDEVEFHLGDEVERMVKVSLTEFARCLDDQLSPMAALTLGDHRAVSMHPCHVFLHNREYLASVFDYIRGRESRRGTD